MPLTYIDIFAGAGGLSEGFVRNGHIPVAHVEMKKEACLTLKTRTCYYYLLEHGLIEEYNRYLRNEITRDELYALVPRNILDTVIQETMCAEGMPALFARIDALMQAQHITDIDVLVGGPPCQAYSLVGRARSENNMEGDARNFLYQLYADVLEHYHPRMFVFENVMGIKSANGGATWLKVQAELKEVGYEIECHEQNSKNFGVLQSRRRMIIVGWLKDSGLSYPEFEKKTVTATVNDILEDLPTLHPGEQSTSYRTDVLSQYLAETGIRSADDVLTHHCARTNKSRDIEIYKKTIELWNDGHKRLNYSDLPEELKTHKNRKSFLDRFKVVEGCGRRGNPARLSFSSC